MRNLFGCRVQKVTIDAGMTCPNRDGTIMTGGCIYCNARGSGTGAYSKGLSIPEQLENGIRFLSKRYKAQKFIAYFQSFSNTYASVDTLEKLYRQALSVKNVVGLSIGTRPDCISESILDLLQDLTQHHLIWLEYGLQSASDMTLKRIHRGHDVHCFEQAVVMTRNRGIKICAHVILGLPAESRRHMMDTARLISRLNIDGVKIHLLYVIRDTLLADLYASGEYECLQQETYAELVCDFIERIPENMVIQRLTGDPHREELVAPMWALEKHKTLSMIRRRLEERDTWQGKFSTKRISE